MFHSIYKYFMLLCFVGLSFPALINVTQIFFILNITLYLDNEICEIFPSCFKFEQKPKTQTRNNKCLIKLLGIKTEYSRKSFHFMGAKLYNDLPIDLLKSIEKLSLFINVKTC